MSAYLGFAARPIGFTDDATSLRALPLDQVAAGQPVQLLAAGALQFWIVRWDPAEVAPDDGSRYFIPDSIVFPAPGRWVTEGATAALPNTYVLRDGAGASVVSFAPPLTILSDTAANNTAPDFLVLEHTTTDGANGAVGLGAGIAFKAEDSAGVSAIRAQIQGKLVTATGNDTKIDFSCAAGGFYGVRASVDGANFKSFGDLLCAGKVDRTTAAPLSLGGTATQITAQPSTGQVNWQKGASLARTDGFDPAGTNFQLHEPGVTAVSESWTVDASAAGGAWTRTGQQGAAGFVGGILSFTTGLGGTPGADLAGSFDVDLGATVSQATAQLRLLSAGTQFAGVRAIAGNLLSIEALASSPSSGGISISTPALLQFLLLDDQEVVNQWGTLLFTAWHRKVITTVNATETAAFSFSIPSSASGMIELLVGSVDQTNGDRARYRRLYSFTRRNGAAALMTAIGADVVYQDDATWSARATLASPTITARVIGDATNQVQHDVQWRVHYQTFAVV